MLRKVGDKCSSTDTCMNSTCVEGICRLKKGIGGGKDKRGKGTKDVVAIRKKAASNDQMRKRAGDSSASIFDKKTPLLRRIGEACKVTTDCPAGAVCSLNVCRKSCRALTDCPLDFSCVPVTAFSGLVCMPAEPRMTIAEDVSDDHGVLLSPMTIWPTAAFLVTLVIWVSYAIIRDLRSSDHDEHHPVIVIEGRRQPTQPTPSRASIYAKLSPAGTVVIPEPYVDDIPPSPLEKREFSEALNLAAHIPTAQPDIEILSKDPDLDSQSAWER